MKQQTAVEYLFERLERKIFKDALNNADLKEYYQQAKEMERQQIIEAYRTGVEEDVYNNPLKTGEQYYNERYSQ